MSDSEKEKYLVPTPPPADVELLQPSEAAYLLRFGTIHVYRLLKSGTLRGHKIGRHWRIPRKAITEYIDGACKEATK